MVVFILPVLQVFLKPCFPAEILRTQQVFKNTEHQQRPKPTKLRTLGTVLTVLKKHGKMEKTRFLRTQEQCSQKLGTGGVWVTP